MDFSLTGGNGQVSWQITNNTAGWGVDSAQASSPRPACAAATASQRRESPTRRYPLADFGKMHFTDTFIDEALASLRSVPSAATLTRVVVPSRTWWTKPSDVHRTYVVTPAHATVLRKERSHIGGQCLLHASE